MRLFSEEFYMKKPTILLAILLINTAGFGLAAAQSQAAAKDSGKKPLTFSEYKNSVANVDFEKHILNLQAFEKLYGNSDVHILDLRSEFEYKLGHVKHAILFGADMSEERLKQAVPDKNSTIIIYCNNSFYPSRMISLTYSSLPQIVAMGYSKVFALDIVRQERPRTDYPLPEYMWEKGTTVRQKQ